MQHKINLHVCVDVHACGLCMRTYARPPSFPGYGIVLLMPTLAFGTANLGPEDWRRCRRLLYVGYRHLDTAPQAVEWYREDLTGQMWA
jgi:hypothetical protein